MSLFVLPHEGRNLPNVLVTLHFVFEPIVFTHIHAFCALLFLQKSNLKRRVSFSEMNLETVHQFQREEIRHSDDSDDENTRVMLKRVTIIDDEPDGPTTELHPMLSPLGGAKPPKKAWTPSNLMVQEPDDDDAPPDMYTDVSEDVAALMW